MSGLVVHIAIFLASGAIVFVAGTLLAKYGDAISERTGVGGLWIGSVFLAGATSLPELATDVSAVRIGAVDLAAGDLFGSSMANMLTLAIIDLLNPRVHVLRRVALDHALVCSLAIVLDGLAGIFIIARPQATVLGVSPASALILAIYVVGTRAVFRQATRPREAEVSVEPPVRAPAPAAPTLSHAITGFVLAALAILAAAPHFAASAKGIADATGLGTTFFGTLVVGFSTSLPELVSSFAAVRMGALDLAVGNLFGSNAYNMGIFFVLDIVHPGAPIFAAVSATHVLTAILAMILMATGLAAVMFRAERRFAIVEPDSLLMAIMYALGMWLIYTRSG